jgi:NUMOD3 motif-containing protein
MPRKSPPPFTAEHRAKIGAAARGRGLSPEHRAKIGDSLRGMKRPPAFSAKQRARWTAEARAQLSEKMREKAKDKIERTGPGCK